jgi:DNA-binding Xre family transcriptional regulator
VFVCVSIAGCGNASKKEVLREGTIMPVSCHLRILLARLNVERAKQGQPAVSLRALAEESGVSLSVLVALHTGRNQRVDYSTLDRLLSYFSRFLPVTMNDLLVWEPMPGEETPVAMA